MYYQNKQEEYDSHMFMEKVRRDRNIGVFILSLEVIGFSIYLMLDSML